ncbi:MAG TPA: patatin-like phospholipase family protein [Bradyrhizobium sp.]|nr:patatin-like phospholipase family protein [Bradyrhizobium sp.]
MIDDALPNSPVKVAQDAATFQWGEGTAQPGIGIALSGGGFRAMLFHAGALARMNELGLVSKAKRIASVSGGSITSGYLAVKWADLGKADANGAFANFKTVVVEPILGFSRQKIDVVDALTGLLPWESASGEVAKSYDGNLYRGKTLQDLPDSPNFVFCATNLQTGVLWRFTKSYAGDYVIGYLDKPSIRIAEAVAASSAFPPVLSPFILKPHAGSFKDWPDGPHVAPGDLPAYREQVVLCDGGVYDNHGIEPIVKSYLTDFVSDGGAPFQRKGTLHTDWISQLKRIVDVTDNQVRALRRRDLIDRFVEGKKIGNESGLTANGHARLGAYWGIDTDPRKVDAAGAIPCNPDVTHKLAQLGTRLSDLGDTVSKQAINWGYAACDRSLRVNYAGPLYNAPPTLPYPGAPLT